MNFQDCKVPELVSQARICFCPKDLLRIGSGFYGFSSDKFFKDFLKKKLIDIGFYSLSLTLLRTREAFLGLGFQDFGFWITD